MTLSLFQTNIPKRGDLCAAGQEVIQPGEVYYSVLLEKDEMIIRQDFCVTCWKQLSNHDALPSEVHWKSKAAPKKEEKIKSKDRESRAFDLLKQFLNDNSPEAKADAFILALFLARRRWLYLRQQITQNDGTVLYLYEVAATEEMLAVTRIALSQIEIQEAQERLASYMFKA